MDPVEIACGWVSGYEIDPLPRTQAAPRVALDEVLARYLEFSPCLIAFSGGRDSSALLAAAVSLARREGLPLPVPVTLAYPGVADTDEASWQRRVLEYVGVTDRIVLEVDDEHDAVGPIATGLLRRHGQLWPPNIAPTWRMMDQARGGALLTGEGGDEIFGLKRITPLTKVLKTRGRVGRRVYPLAAEALAPAWVRRRAALRTRYRPPWLREPAQALVGHRYAQDMAAFALHAGRHAWQFAARRGTRRGLENLRAVASELDVAYGHPFQEPAFLAAFAAESGFWGWTGRTATMRYLFDDLLPPDVLERQTKAVFNNAVFTEHTRAFARGWGGDGVDAELVDPDILRAHWLSATPHGPSMALLQKAWLHTSPDLSRLSRR
jgi:asparagine synthase (glutamine-hydrolysing)